MSTSTIAMRKIAKSFEQADLRPLFDVIAENVVWKSGSTVRGSFLFGGTYAGRLGVLEVTAEISAGLRFSAVHAERDRLEG